MPLDKRLQSSIRLECTVTDGAALTELLFASIFSANMTREDEKLPVTEEVMGGHRD